MKVLLRAKEWVDTSDALLAHWLRAAREALLGEMPILAAGTALFALISTLPLLAAVVSIYGLVADPGQIQAQLGSLTTVLPNGVVEFLREQLEQQAQRSHQSIGIALAFSVIIAVFSSRGAARALIDTLNRAYRVREKRGKFHKFGLTLMISAGTMVGLLVVIIVVVALPGIFAIGGMTGYAIAEWLRWPILMAVLFATLLGLYRYAPSPRELGTERHLWPGALLGTVVLVLVSVGLSQWVTKVAAYDVIYGAFGSVVVVLLWFYLSVIALVLGGFVNAELERHAGAPAPDRSMY